MANVKNEIDSLKTEITGLKIRILRLEELLLTFPNPENYLHLPEDDEYYGRAVEIVKEYDKASASLIQRKLSIGYARASRLLDMLEKEGILGPADGAKPREVFKDKIKKYQESKKSE